MTEAYGQTAGVAVARTGLSISSSPSDREQLAAMVSSNGHGHVLADRLLARFGSVAAIARAHPAELTVVEGIGQATATRLVAAFQLARQAIVEQPPVRLANDEDTVTAVAPMLRGRTRERLVVVICNRALRVIGYEVVSEGSAERALLPVREAVVAVLRRDGQAFAVAHNHPSGDANPSNDDLDAIGRMQRAAEATELRFLGHLVVTDTDWRRVPDCPSWARPRVERRATC